MTNRKRVLIFYFHQFGLLVDSMKYCEYANNEMDITYLGWDYGKPRIEIPRVKVLYVSREGGILKRNVRLLMALNKEVRSGNYDVTFIHYTRGVSLVRIFNLRKKTILDIRTLSIERSFIKRNIFNLFLKIESLFFYNKTVISEGVARQMKLKRYSLLPLGADVIHLEKKEKGETFNLLYVGALEGREIIKCVKGLEIYIKNTGDHSVRLTIVGDGAELEEIIRYVGANAEISDKIICTGYVPHKALRGYFEWASVGISFVPITKWYNFQPPTKTFEYLLAGLPVIATRTHENEIILKGEEFCELIQDEALFFAQAVERIKTKINRIPKGQYFKDKYEIHKWEYIVTKYFSPVIRNLVGRDYEI